MKRTGFLKLICLILAISVMFTTFIVQVAAEEAVIEEATQIDKEMSDIISLLNRLGIGINYSGDNVDINKEITSAEFVSAVDDFANMNYSAGEAYYYDVPKTHWAFDEIGALTKAGILKGTGDRLFKPNDPISTNVAYKIIMSVLGYEKYAQSKGGDLAGYVAAAQFAGVNVGIRNTEKLLLSDMFEILYNALTAPVMEAISWTDDGPIFAVSRDNDIAASVYKSVNCIVGTLDGARNISLTGAALEDGEIIVAGKKLKFDLDVYDYLGESVKVFYRIDKNATMEEAVYVFCSNHSEVYNVNINNNAEFNPSTYLLKYTEGDRAKKLQIDKKLVIVYNGGIYQGNISSLFNSTKYTLKLVKNQDKADVAVVSKFTNYYVKYKFPEDMTIVGSNGDKLEFDTDVKNYEKVIIRKNGTLKSFEDINVGQVLSVFISEDQKYLSVDICDEVVAGRIDSTKTAKGGKVLAVNGNEYLVPKTAGIADSLIAAGNGAELYLDITGEVAYVKALDTAYIPAYLLQGKLDEESFSKSIKVRYLSNDGKLVTTEAADRIVIDGRSFKDMSQAFAKLCEGGNFKQQFVLMLTNAEGEISGIDTTNTDMGGKTDILEKGSIQGKKAQYRGSAMVWTHGASYSNGDNRCELLMNNSTRVFRLPNEEHINSNIEKYFQVGSYSVLPSNATLVYESYKTKEQYFAQYVVAKELPGTKVISNFRYNYPAVIETVSQVVDEDTEEVVTQISCWISGSLIKYILDEDVFVVKNVQTETAITSQVMEDYKIKAGDVGLLELVNGKVTQMRKIFDMSDPEQWVNPTYPGFGGITKAVGRIADVDEDGAILIEYGAQDESYTMALNGKYGCPVYVWDTTLEENSVSSGSIDTAKPRRVFPSKFSYIITSMETELPRQYLIVNY